VSMGNDNPVGPVGTAEPPDAAPKPVEYWAQGFVNALFQDGGLDAREMKIVQATFAEIQQRVMQQQQQGVGPDGRPLPNPQAPGPQTPASANESDFNEQRGGQPIGGYLT